MPKSRVRYGLFESPLLQAVPIAFGVLSRSLIFQFRNPAMTKLATTKPRDDSDPVSLRSAMPQLAPVLEKLCRTVLQTRRTLADVSITSPCTPQRGCYRVDIFPVATQPELLIGLAIKDVTCHTLQVLAAITAATAGRMTRALTESNQYFLRRHLESNEEERRIFRTLLHRSEQVALSARKVLPGTSQFPLSSRETEVLTLIAEGKTTKEIASMLAISERTVSTHRERIMQKLDLHDVTALARYAIRHGLVY